MVYDVNVFSSEGGLYLRTLCHLKVETHLVIDVQLA